MNPLDDAWKQINSLGGSGLDRNVFDPDGRERAKVEGYNDAIGEALNIIEKLGGMDPLRRGVKA